MSAEEQNRLRSLFYAYDVDKSGRIERDEFLDMCAELQVSAAEADRIFHRLDVDQDGTVTLPEFISGFHERYGDDMEPSGDVSAAWEHFERRLGEKAKFIPRWERTPVRWPVRKVFTTGGRIWKFSGDMNMFNSERSVGKDDTETWWRQGTSQTISIIQ